MESLIKVMTDLFLEENKPEDPVEYPFCIEILSSGILAPNTLNVCGPLTLCFWNILRRRIFSIYYVGSCFPECNFSYIKSFLIDRHRPEGESSILRTDLREARKEIKNLKKQVDSLTKRLEKYESVMDEDNA
jgi:hypothetical protein